MNQHNIRVRFAPSPTGHLHIGGLRTTLFNWLFARHNNGSFLVRIEDTDLERSREEYVQSILDSLTWAGIHSDEPIIFQTQRFERYREVAQQLVTEGKAYRCYCPPVADRLDQEHSKYDGRCRNRVSLPEDAHKSYVIRFKFPLDQQHITFTDLIHGEISFPLDQFDDFIIVRTDGVPVYNFVVVVDDIDMRITHIVRGEDHISNTPKQMQIYKALNARMPFFGHVPLILGAGGQPLSKRDAATSVQDYVRNGYLADALINYLVRLGWSHGDQEIFSREQMIAAFSLEAVGKSGSIFDQTKLDWINSVYIKQTDSAQLLKLIVRDVHPNLLQEIAWSAHYIESWIDLLKDRVKTLAELARELIRIFKGEYEYDFFIHNIDAQGKSALERLKTIFANIEPFSVEVVTDSLKKYVKDEAIALPVIAKLMRLALVGKEDGPSLFKLIALFGKDEVAQRIDRFLQKLPS